MVSIRTLSIITAALLLFGCNPSTTNENIQSNDNSTNTEKEKNVQEELSSTTVKKYTNNLDSKFFGRWTYVDSSEVLYITDITPLESNQISMINNDQITITQDGETKHLIRSGIENVHIAGEIATLEDSTKKAPTRKGFSLNKLKVKLKHKVTELVKEYKVDVTSEKEKIGSIKDNVLYLTQSQNGNLIIPEKTDLTMPSGEIKLSIINEENNQTTSLDVNLAGEETDIGVATLTNTPYNFKSSIVSQNYNNDNTIQSETYFANMVNNVTLSICNIGTKSISGSSFEIKPHNESKFLTFQAGNNEGSQALNHEDGTFTYKSAAIGFEAGECKEYPLSFMIKKPTEVTKYKIDIVIKDNFKHLTWNDYVSLKVAPYSQEETQTIKIHSNQKTINGYLVTKGNKILHITSNNGSIVVPKDPKATYELVLSAKSISDEDVYAISTGGEINLQKMQSFVDVTKNEPDNNKTTATTLALTGDAVMSYLSQGDIDYYIIKDLPRVRKVTKQLYHKNEKVYVSFYSDLNSSSLNTENISVFDENEEKQPLHIEVIDTKNIAISFDNNLSNGTYKLYFSNIQTVGGHFLTKPIEQNFSVKNVTETQYMAIIPMQLAEKHIGNGLFYETQEKYLIQEKNYTYVSDRFECEAIDEEADNQCKLLSSTTDIYETLTPLKTKKIATLSFTEEELKHNYYVRKIWDKNEHELLVWLKSETDSEDKKLVIYNKATMEKTFEYNLTFSPKDIVFNSTEMYALSYDNNELYKYAVSENNLTFIQKYSDLNITSDRLTLNDDLIFFTQNKVANDNEDNERIVAYSLNNFSLYKVIKSDIGHHGYYYNESSIYNNKLYFVSENSHLFLVYDINKDETHLLDNVEIGEGPQGSSKGFFVVQGNYLYTVNSSSEVVVYDLTDLDNIIKVAQYTADEDNDSGIASVIQKPFIKNNYLYIGSYSWALPLK